MNELKDTTSRRAFLSEAGRIAGVSTLAGITLPHVHAAENNTIQLALVGCGGRGTGAVENALGIKNGPIKLVAMADVFPQKLSDSHGHLRGRFASQMDVPMDRQFIVIALEAPDTALLRQVVRLVDQRGGFARDGFVE